MSIVLLLYHSELYAVITKQLDAVHESMVNTMSYIEFDYKAAGYSNTFLIQQISTETSHRSDKHHCLITVCNLVVTLHATFVNRCASNVLGPCILSTLMHLYFHFNGIVFLCLFSLQKLIVTPASIIFANLEHIMANTSKQNKEYRWRLLDGILSEGEPVSRQQIFALFKQHKVPVKGDDFLPSFRKDVDFFKKALKEIGMEDMLVVGRGALPKVSDSGLDHRTRTYCYREKGFSVIPYLTGGMSDFEYRNLVASINRLRGSLSEQTFEEVRFAIQSRIEADYQKGPLIVDYEDNHRLKGREYLPVFYSAIKEKQTLRMRYRTFKGKSFSFDFHPYLLKQYNERWFAFGLRPDKKNPYTNIPLDRLEGSPRIVGHYSEDRPQDYLDYFKDIVGVSKDRKSNTEDVRHIVIRITDIDSWGRITTKPLPTQATITPFDTKKGYGRIALALHPNKELFSRILSWGESVEIESSGDGGDIRKQMVAMIRRIAHLYPEIYFRNQ